MNELPLPSGPGLRFVKRAPRAVDTGSPRALQPRRGHGPSNILILFWFILGARAGTEPAALLGPAAESREALGRFLPWKAGTGPAHGPIPIRPARHPSSCPPGGDRRAAR